MSTRYAFCGREVEADEILSIDIRRPAEGKRWNGDFEITLKNSGFRYLGMHLVKTYLPQAGDLYVFDMADRSISTMSPEVFYKQSTPLEPRFLAGVMPYFVEGRPIRRKAWEKESFLKSKCVNKSLNVNELVFTEDSRPSFCLDDLSACDWVVVYD